MIKPTLGRIVLLRPKDPSYDVDKRHAAIIASVNNDGTVNLGVFNDYGVHENAQNITLVQDEAVPECNQCEWMPYQKGQAAKTDDLTSLLLARIDRLETLLTSDMVGLELPELIGSEQAEEIPDNVTDIVKGDDADPVLEKLAENDKTNLIDTTANVLAEGASDEKDDSAGSSDTGGATAATDDVTEDDAGADEATETEAEALGEEVTESAALMGLKAHASEVAIVGARFFDADGNVIADEVDMDAGGCVNVQAVFADDVEYTVTFDEWKTIDQDVFIAEKVATS